MSKRAQAGDQRGCCSPWSPQCDDGWDVGAHQQGAEGQMSSESTMEEDLAAKLDLGRKRRTRDVCPSMLFLFWGLVGVLLTY